MERKLVSVQTITDIRPIDGADRIEVARVLGWNVVVGKNEFSINQKIAYFEVDSFLRGDKDIFEPFLKRGTKKFIIDGSEVEGHVLKTIKLRGVVSQGLIMSLEDLELDSELPVGTDVTADVGVVKWDPPLPASNGEIIGTFDTKFAPKTDAIRLQSIADFWDEIQKIDWEPTVKVDGTSQTLLNDDGRIRIFGRNWEIDTETSPGFEVASKLGFIDAIENGMAVQFELVGPNVQSNRLKLPTNSAIVFAVWKNGVKVARSDWPDAILKHATPILDDEFKPTNHKTVDGLIEFIKDLRGNVTPDARDEGVVFHPVDPEDITGKLATVIDRNGNFKVISSGYLLKHKI